MTKARYLCVLAALGLAGCGAPAPAPITAPAPGGLTGAHLADPPSARPGACWARDTRPAMIETVTEQFREPAPDGRGADRYRTETRQRILRDRQELWFETPCPEAVDAAFVASLQRALAARGVYRGPVTGTADSATRAALRRYQARLGLDSDVLSMDAARQLGLVAYDTAPGG
ncbi:hypothetical protein Ga0609869_000337 [Rhodovulum iodosum]|uniref:Peptidoglycan binding-like domain-containing protein n=1 Tax=Rhodovulum iodosum TaxID=68291 RepID=A0ABV3XP41_9RHOB|nr:peptidoglycan-binding domain-containing protein [Rhodovulum robiginosum]RSK37927.1 peptidoglycan-binding protein [Rhodovulum robiginosum]